jgi:predicted small lipoprotein YifL
MRRYTLPAALLLTFGLLAGCGQKGPLYLPPAQPAVATPAPAASAAKPASVAPAPAATTLGG